MQFLNMGYFNNLVPCIFLLYSFIYFSPSSFRSFTDDDLKHYRNKVTKMFRHAYESYLTNAFPFDELKPLSCNGIDTWGSFSLTLIDALDTLAVMQNFTEFRRVVKLLVSTADFNININVSVFETNIRVVGGLISAHLLSHKAGVAVDAGWPCSGPLLQLAEGVARRLLPAFNTDTGMPYGTVNLRYGVPLGETPVTCTAGVSTFILEFGTLSRLTGDPVFEHVALRALYALWERRSSVGLVGNHINVQDGKWTAMDAGIGGGVDSYYEYLLKGAILFQDPNLMHMFKEYYSSIQKHMCRDDWYFWVSMGSGQVTMPVFQSLEAFWPGLLSLYGQNDQALKSLHNYHQVWKQFGFTPEFYDVAHSHVKREGYPLRPELIESIMYLYRATKDPYLLEMGVDILESIEFSSRTKCGYATVKNVVDHRIEDRMESFFLAETTKYLYLLFDPTNFIHNNGSCGEIVGTTGGDCLLGAGGYIFNTEAHPIDIASVYCCSKEKKEHDELLLNFQNSMDLHVLLNIKEKGDFFQLFKQYQKKRTVKSVPRINITSEEPEEEPAQIDTEVEETVLNIKTVPLETQYSHGLISDDNDHMIPISSTRNKEREEFLRQLTKSESLKAKDNDILAESKPSSSFFIKFVRGDTDSDGDSIENPIGEKEYYLDDDEEEEEEDNGFQKLPSSHSSALSTAEKSGIDTSRHMLPNDSDEENLDIEQIYVKNFSNFSGVAVKAIPIISLNNGVDLDLNVSLRAFEPKINYEVLSCPAQPFISRLSVMGEMVNTDL